MRGWAEALNRLTLAVAGVFLAAMIGIAGAGVFYRYVLHHSLSWSDEAASYLFIWLIFLGAAADVWGGGHPSITLLVGRLPGRARTAAHFLATAAIMAWGAILLVYGLRGVVLETPESWASIPSLSLQGPFAAIPAGGALILIFAAARASNSPR